MNELPEGAELLIDGAAGKYLPTEFASRFGYLVDGFNDELNILMAGHTEDEEYEQAWDEVLDSARIQFKENGPVFRLHQDLDLFIYPSED